jgi:hypothetical protein
MRRTLIAIIGVAVLMMAWSCTTEYDLVTRVSRAAYGWCCRFIPLVVARR